MYIEEVTFGTKKKWSVNSGSIHMKISTTGQENGDLLIQVTAIAKIYVRPC
jgi:hypothetical protein